MTLVLLENITNDVNSPIAMRLDGARFKACHHLVLEVAQKLHNKLSEKGHSKQSALGTS